MCADIGLGSFICLAAAQAKKGETIAGSADLQASSQAMSRAAAAFMASQVHTFSTIREHWVPLPVAGAPEIMTLIGSLLCDPLLCNIKQQR